MDKPFALRPPYWRPHLPVMGEPAETTRPIWRTSLAAALLAWMVLVIGATLASSRLLENLPGGFSWLQKNQRADVILYFETMADLLEKKLRCVRKLPNLIIKSAGSSLLAYT